MHEFGLVGRRHHHHVGQDAEKGDVERAGMGRAIRADEARPVDGEANRQILDRHVMDDLIIAALEKGRINRAERLVAFGREAGGESDRMLLGDADVEACARERTSGKYRAPCRSAWRR